jgi:hypothetical protein
LPRRARGATQTTTRSRARVASSRGAAVARVTTTSPSPNANAHRTRDASDANRAPRTATSAPPLAWPRRGVARVTTGAANRSSSSRRVANLERVKEALAVRVDNTIAHAAIAHARREANARRFQRAIV